MPRYRELNCERLSISAPIRPLLLFILALWCSLDGTLADAAEPMPGVCELPGLVIGNTALAAGCTYHGGVVVGASNLTLDCAGAIIDASAVRTAIAIRGRGLHDIVVRNCHIVNPKGIGVLVSTDLEEADKSRLPVAERYAASPSRVSIQDITVTGAGNVGIYVDSYAQDTDIRNVTVMRSGGPGMYLEFSSVRTSLSGSTISANGFGTQEKPRRRGGLREGLAIDSSSDNRIIGNRFAGNAGGGVFLYKNCHEHQERENSVERWMPATNNLIAGNSFEESGIGVWIASRQSRNLRSWNCGDQAYAPGFYRDYAPSTIVSGNSFSGAGIGIRIEDDGATIADNVLSTLDVCVLTGTQKRSEILGLPVSGTALRQNNCTGGNGSSFVFLFGSHPKTCGGNTVNGLPWSCSGL